MANWIGVNLIKKFKPFYTHSMGPDQISCFETVSVGYTCNKLELYICDIAGWVSHSTYTLM